MLGVTWEQSDPLCPESRYATGFLGWQKLAAIIFSFIASYIRQRKDMQVVCATGIVGFVIIAFAALETGIAAEHIRSPVAEPDESWMRKISSLYCRYPRCPAWFRRVRKKTSREKDTGGHETMRNHLRIHQKMEGH